MYLVDSTQPPITAAQVRAVIGLASDHLDGIIDAGIEVATIDTEFRLRTQLRRRVWAIQKMDHKPLADFFRAVRQIGKVQHIGPAYPRYDNPSDRFGAFHNCTFAADPRHLKALIQVVAMWCMRQDDICDAIAAERHHPVDVAARQHVEHVLQSEAA